MNNKPLKNRINNLENQPTTDSEINVWVCWCEPGKCTCPPADQVISWDDDDNIQVTT